MNLVAQVAKREFDVMIAVPTGPAGTKLAKKFTERSQRYWDVHSGTNETSTALALFPELVEMWRIPEDWKPSNNMSKELKEMRDPDRDDWELVSQLYGACAEPDTDDFTKDGIYGWDSPLDGDPEEYLELLEERVEFVAEFIKRWKKIPTPPAFEV
jgi:creatinine amidohydrolase/Fe(II)-dependent formamide hydrolase-like protein